MKTFKIVTLLSTFLMLSFFACQETENVAPIPTDDSVLVQALFDAAEGKGSVDERTGAVLIELSTEDLDDDFVASLFEKNELVLDTSFELDKIQAQDIACSPSDCSITENILFEKGVYTSQLENYDNSNSSYRGCSCSCCGRYCWTVTYSSGWTVKLCTPWACC